MGYRFHRLNPMLQSFYTRLSSPTHKYFHAIPSIPSLNLHPQTTLLGIYDDPKSKICRRWHLGHSHRHDDDHRFGREGENIFKLGLGADIGLAVGKAVTGYLSGSTAIIADAAHSVSDVVLSGIALWSFKAGKAPKDKEHPYGHS